MTTKLNEQNYRKLISGQSRGLGAALLRFFLGIAAQLYSTVIRLRNFLYSKGWLKTYRANAIVFSIGNITTGGTGKTPLTIWLCRFLQNKNIACAILTRGYKTDAEKRVSSIEYRVSRTDEPAILAESCPEAKVIVNPDRVAGAAVAVGKFGAKVLIMDDGFQHRRLGRDLDIVTIDATCPFGYGKMLPAGLLREPAASLKRADAVVITRCNQTGETELAQLEEKLRLVNPDMIIARSMHNPICVKSIGHKEISLEELKDKKIFAFCGIGNPDAFLNTIKELGLNLVGSKIYNDHYRYTDNCFTRILEEAEHLKADVILTTQKDWYSSPAFAPAGSVIPAKAGILFTYLAIELKFIGGEDKITQLIEDVLAGKIPRN